ncbi:MAG: SLC13 family permease [Alphaproteobacteria bacterium]|nr:SLC13 family permease [Alphaproteobacteria bacterium]
MDFILSGNIHILFALTLTVFAILAFIRERIPIEITSVALLTALLLFGQFFPILDETGKNKLEASAFLAGFANPSLIAVLALLVMGQGMIQTDALRIVTDLFVFKNHKMAWFSIISTMMLVCILSAFMNNTPLVVIAIPIIQALANSAGMSESRVMIPLSYIAILGGMTTLIGSSTNLLVSSAMVELGYASLQFFQFAIPGVILAFLGFLYVIAIVPRLLPDRMTMVRDFTGSQKEFVAEIDIENDSQLIGMECIGGQFPELKDLSVKLIQRTGHLILPPFEQYTIQAGDALIVTASREALANILSKHPGFLLSDEEAKNIHEENNDENTGEQQEARVLAEIMITPASRMVDMSLEHVNFQRQFNITVLGIQRRAKTVRRRVGRIRLEAGDVLLITGTRSAVNALRGNTDVIVLSGSKRDLLAPKKAPIAATVFAITIGLAATGILNIPVAAITGAVMMLATGCLNIRQATRAIDRKIFLLVGSMLALGYILQVSGAAHYIAGLIMGMPFTQTPLILLALLFLLVAISTNILTNNACAILYTPIAMDMAEKISVPENVSVDMSFLFAVTVIFATNCSFASPIGYQTNLLVMGPGHYQFRDFLKAGIPLVLILWITYILILKYYYGL